MKRLLLILLLMTSLPASAGAFDVLAGYVCDKKADELHITYARADDKARVTMKANRVKTQWDPWDLAVYKDEDRIGSLRTARAKCRLSDGVYAIEITPSPGNFNVQGRCGAWMTAGARVFKGNKEIYSIERFDSDCVRTEPIVVRVTAGPKWLKPVETVISWDEFYK